MSTLAYEDIHQHYEVYGSGEPFFLHHGLTSSCEMWHPHLPWLTPKHQVILMDARGHGMTTAPAGDDHYSWEIMAADVNRLLEHLGIERAIIGGLSMGGGVSLAFALNYPQKVRALILCDSAGVGVRSPQMQVTREQMDRQMEAREQMVKQYGVVEQGYRSIVAGLAPKAVLEDPVLQEEYIERMSHFSANGSIYASRFVMRNAVQGVERTRELTMPTLVVIGEEDVGLLPAAEWLRDNLPNRRYAFLKGVGHATSRYKPEAWRKAVLDFLDDFEQGKDIRGEVTL